MKLKLEILKFGMIFRFNDGVMTGIITDVDLKSWITLKLDYKLNRMKKWRH